MSEAQKISSALMFQDGQMGAFDEHGYQISELQKGLLSMWAEEAIRLGYDPEGVEINNMKIHHTDECGWITLSVKTYDELHGKRI